MIKVHTLNETSTCQREFVVCGTSQTSPWDGSWILDLNGTAISVHAAKQHTRKKKIDNNF